MFPSPVPIPTQQVFLPLLEEKQVELYVKRLDVVHPDISGNKYFKLKHNLAQARREGHHRVLTFGGAFSNHIRATAVAAHLAGMLSVGCIRGEVAFPLNPTLQAARDAGMVLFPMERSIYRKKSQEEVVDRLKEEFGDFYLLPEGGTNGLAIQGCTEILTPEDKRMDVIGTAIGTGGTIAGLIAAASKQQRIIGVSSLKGEFIRSEVQGLLDTHGIAPQGSWEVFTDYHFGGYARHTSELLDFVRYFHRETEIPLDPIYTGKLFFGIWDLIGKNYFPPHSRILLIHTGGLQGIAGFEKRWGTRLYPDPL